MWILLVLFVSVPILEIALFIVIGDLIGLFPTLACIILTAIAGTWLVRSQGLSELRKLERAVRGQGNPVEPIAHGALILVAGILLLTPGFFTDGVGFLLLVPAVRIVIAGFIAERALHASSVRMASSGSGRRARHAGGGRASADDADIVDGEFEVIDTPEKDR